jgi:hypothetical protein
MKSTDSVPRVLMLAYACNPPRAVENTGWVGVGRLRVSNYCRLHREAGWAIQAEDSTLGSVEDLCKVPLAKEFHHYSQRDLLAVRSWLASCLP